MKEIKFANLHCHTTNSVFDGIGYPKDYIDYILENGLNTNAFTEHGNCNSFPHYYLYSEQLRKKGVDIKSIPGIEAYFIHSLKDWQNAYDEKQKSKEEAKLVKVDNCKTNYEDENETRELANKEDIIKKRNHLILLSQNEQGLKNLFTLVSKSYKNGFYRFPRMDFDMIKEHSDGLICLTACISGPFASEIFKGQHQEKSFDEIQMDLQNLTDKFVDIFGEERFFYEIQFNKLKQQHIVNEHMIKLSKSTGIKLVATNDCHYPRPEHWKERELYRKLGRLSYRDTNLKLPETKDDIEYDLYPKNGMQTFEAYKEYSGDYDFYDDDVVINAIENSWNIAQGLTSNIEFDKSMKLPSFSNSEKTEFQQLTEHCIRGLKDRDLHKQQEYVDRLKYELTIIKDKKFENYFLTLHKAIDEVSNHMIIGPARGSGGGSLINYLLGITQVDPIRFNLIFERFLNPARAAYPDVDLDFENKETVTKILRGVFGEDNVLSISNYNTLQLRSLIKDISKFYDIPFQEVNQVTRVMDSEVRRKILKKGDDKNLFQLTLKNAKAHSKSFQEFIEKYPQIIKHIEVLYQQVRSTSRHAGGLLIADDLDSLMPVIISKGERQSPWTEGVNYKHLEEFGFLKFDCLALLTLRIMRSCIEKILIKQDDDPSFTNVRNFYSKYLHPDTIDFDDNEVYKNVWHKSRYPAIFQFTEKGAQKFGTKFKPESIEDISSITSIFRPGPLAADVDKIYLKNKKNPENVVYDHPAIKEVLGDTYGSMIYQEQVMALANKLAGMSLPECDTLRKVILKRVFSTKDDAYKKREELKIRFIEGCVENNYSRNKAEKLFKNIEYAAGYLFNRSHSIAYSIISYQCAWLFTHYEKEWLNAYLENKEGTDKQERAINEIKKFGYKFKKPDINKSSDSWEINGKTIYFSLSALKGLGKKVVKQIIENQPYKDLDELLYGEKSLSKKTLDVLTKVGALQSMKIVGENKSFKNYKQLYDVIIENSTEIRHRKKGKVRLNELIGLSSGDYEDWSVQEKIKNYSEIMGTVDIGLVLTKKINNKLKDYKVKSIDEFNPENSEDIVWFVIKDITTKKTKNGKDYAVLSIMGESGVEYLVRQWNSDGKHYKNYSVYVAKLSYDTNWGYSLKGYKSTIFLG